jgi:hypothetical protein
MSDTFPNGPGASGGEVPQAGDVTGTLAELERKLRELESELSSIGRRRDLTAPAPGRPSASGVTSASGVETERRLVDEAIEPVAPLAPPPVPSMPPPPAAMPAPPAPPPPPAMPAPPAPPPPPAMPAPPAPSPPPAWPAAAGSSAPSSVQGPSAPSTDAGEPVKFVRPTEPARPPAPHVAAAQERVRPSEAQLASLAELRRFRDRLERFAQDLAAEYDALLGRVMSGLTSTAAASAIGAEDAPSAGELADAAAEAAAFASQASPATPASPEDMLFEGRVELGAGPFYDIASLSAFERRLASLPQVAESSVRRFEASHAVVDVRLATPVALLRELRRTGEGGFSVREVADGRILLTFDEV